jgi:hypothetical protein
MPPLILPIDGIQETRSLFVLKEETRSWTAGVLLQHSISLGSAIAYPIQAIEEILDK